MKPITGRPINRVAARVIRKGFGYDPILSEAAQKRLSISMSETRERRKGAGGDSTEDMTGRRFGRLTVVAYIDKKLRGNAGSRGADAQMWMCRCVCGQFTKRSSKSIRKAFAESMCEACMHTEMLKKRSSAQARKALERLRVAKEST